MIYKTSALLSLALCSSLAVAQSSGYETDDGWRFNPEFSIGVGYGFTKLKDGDFDEDEAAKKAFALVKFNEFVGLEAAYIDFDDAGNDQLRFDPKGYSLGLILEAPITQSFSVYAKGGQLWWDADARVSAGPISGSRDYDGDETFWGVGTKFRLSDNLDLRIEYERFNFEISRDEIDVLQPNDIDMDVDFASISLQFTF